MKQVLFILVLFVLYFTASARVGCKSFCAARALDNGFHYYKDCLETCNHEDDDTAAALSSLEEIRQELMKGVQPEDSQTDLENLHYFETESSETESYEIEALSQPIGLAAAPSPNQQLQATAALNVRNGPCTSNGIIKTIPQGTIVTYANEQRSGCGYTWYKIKGAGINSGWAASNWLVPVGSGCKVRFNPPLYKQCDSRWANDKLGSSSTICKVGCLMTSVAMAMNGLGKKINGAAVTPKNLNAFLRANGGYSGNLYVWGAISRFGFRYQGQPTNIQTIKNHVCNGAVVILNIDKGGHWVLATGVNGNTFTINDPGRTRTSVSAGEVLRAGVYFV